MPAPNFGSIPLLVHEVGSDGTSMIGTAGSPAAGVGSVQGVSGGTPINVGLSYSAAVTVTRPADTTAYTANDVIGPAAAAVTFPSMGLSAGRIMITSAALEVDVTAIPSGMTSFLLHLYNVTPPSALADNAAFDLPSGDRASYLGFLSLGAPADLGSTLYVETNGINKQVQLAGTSLFGYLVTVGAYTPSSAGVKKVTLHAVGL